MEFLFSSMFLYEYSIDTIIDACEKAGYDGIEFWVETPHFWIKRVSLKHKNSSLVEMIKDSRIKAIHSPVLDLNPVSVNDGVCDLTLRETLYSINLARKVGVNIVTVHAGRRSAVREPVWSDYASLNNYLRIASKYSRIKNVKLCLENSEPRINYLCKSAEEVKEFMEKYELYFTFDVNHAIKGNYFSRSFLELIDRMENIHVSGYDAKGRHISAIGFEDIKRVLEELSDMGFNKKITVELDDLAYGRMDLKRKIEMLARELDYLRKIFI
ncbi:hypothetical protein Asulf_01269 [Archaeoglobus sulfaticallidus PM70-1]|uniref:Xylose isomerase-like TIM barrel domain-containing protein n=1 Tax=Archaeoglobus sulfaticallidus PM70-1 TaxID=387631 RepID=N0BLY1_9EURY|nr:sugar phosphate isomerase/epimerase [Archaeoglobus sulfaticallidus]AGK61265.1 hypothetical protein Asulf_01269 [Archaeoglobus sulfaticallidus PM70-1]